jgi:hypothetical protein
MQKIKIMNHSAIAKIHVCEIIGGKFMVIKTNNFALNTRKCMPIALTIILLLSRPLPKR